MCVCAAALGIPAEVIQCEMSLEMVHSFLADQIREDGAEGAEGAAAGALDPKFGLRERFPPALLGDAEDFFSA